MAFWELILYALVGLIITGHLAAAASPGSWVFLGLLALLAMAGAYFLLRGSRRRNRLREVLETRATEVRWLALGCPVEVGGAAVMRTPLTAPFSARQCAFFHWRVEAFSGKRWKVLAEGVSEEGFFLRDGTGQVYVEPDAPSVHLGGGLWTWPENEKNPGPFPKHLKELLESRGLVLEEGGKRNLRFREWILEDGDATKVASMAVRPPDYLAGPNCIARLTKTELGNMIISERSPKEVVKGDLASAHRDMVLGGVIMAVFFAVSAFSIYPRMPGIKAAIDEIIQEISW